MTRLLLLLFIIAAAVFPGCQEQPAAQPQEQTQPPAPALPRPNLEKWQAAFKRADKIELYSILPDGDKSDLPKFMNWPIAGSAVITDPKEQEKLYSLLEQFIYDVPEHPFKPTACKFKPHHALSFTDNSGSHRLLICFTCGEVRTESFTLPTYKGEVHLRWQAGDELDELLKAHGVETREERARRLKKMN